MGLVAGTRLGPYEILASIGAGGMGEVYRARDTRLEREVAVKILSPHLSANPVLKQRFEREARAISRLNHPRICVIHDVGRQDATDYFVMEYLAGESLAERLRRGAIPLAETIRAGSEVADGLDGAHRQGLVHRDLKPGNIMLTEHGAKLMDFGLAKPLALGAAAAAGPEETTLTPPEQSLTAHGAIIGTIQYMAPEQLEGKEPDPRSDIFALGVTIYQCATGLHPFEAASTAGTIARILGSEPARLSQVAPAIPAELDRIVRKCLRKNPEERYQTARDLKLDLDSMQQEMRPAAPTAIAVSPATLNRRWWWMHQLSTMFVNCPLIIYLVWQARAAMSGTALQFAPLACYLPLAAHSTFRFLLVAVAIGDPARLPAEARRLRWRIRLSGYALIAGMFLNAALIVNKMDTLAGFIAGISICGLVVLGLVESAVERSAFGESPSNASRRRYSQEQLLGFAMAAGQAFLSLMLAIGLIGLLDPFRRYLRVWATLAARGQSLQFLDPMFAFFGFILAVTVWSPVATIGMFRHPLKRAAHYRRWFLYYFLLALVAVQFTFVSFMRWFEDYLIGFFVFLIMLLVPFMQLQAAARLAPGPRPKLLAMLLPWTKL